jgi:hexosaminidase
VFPYRGLLLDTARNFIPIPDLKRMIDGMALNKLNIFHWHLTDSNSFPFYSKRVPQVRKY